MNMVAAIEHHVIAGVYYRKMFLPSGHKADTHKHLYDHGSLCLQGTGLFIGELKVQYFAGDLLTVKAGIQHSIIAHTDSIWLCIHAVPPGLETIEDKDELMINLVKAA